MWPILVLFGMLAVATPFITIYLLWQQHKLRQRLLKLTDLSLEVSDGLRRDLLELKRQVEAAKAAGPAAEAPAVHPAVHAPVESNRSGRTCCSGKAEVPRDAASCCDARAAQSGAPAPRETRAADCSTCREG